MKYNKFSFLPAALLLAVIFTNCSSNEIGESKDVAQDKIYQQYTVSYSEGNEQASLFAQFRFAGKNGTTLVLTSPSQLSVDNEVMKVDSGKMTGAYYQLYKPVAGFYGIHHIVFTDINNKKIANDFSFNNFKLVNVPAIVAKNKPVDISFETTPLKDGDYIELSTTGSDSSFSITHSAADKGNSITIPVTELKKQKGNEIMLEARLYRSEPLQQNTAEGGVLEIRQTLRAVKIRLQD